MSSNDWLPSAGGRHPVDLGPSLVRALKARSGPLPPKQPKNKFPNNDFYSFRCDIYMSYMALMRPV